MQHLIGHPQSHVMLTFMSLTFARNSSMHEQLTPMLTDRTRRRPKYETDNIIRRLYNFQSSTR